jgi:hypothetical protein
MIIREEEEALIRKAEKEIQNSILEFQKAYAGLTTQDGMAMALITKGVELLKREEELEVINQHLRQWSQLLPAE